MATVLDAPDEAPVPLPKRGTRRRTAVLALVAVLLVTAAIAANGWYRGRIDPLRLAGASGHGGVPVRTGVVQGVMVAFLTADKDGTLRGFTLEGLPDGAELVATRVYFLGQAGGRAVSFPYGCHPVGLNFIASSDGRGVTGRFATVDGTRFRAGDQLQLIAYVRFTQPGPFEIRARVGVRYAVGPLTRTLKVAGQAVDGEVSDNAYPPRAPGSYDCRFPDGSEAAT